MDNNIQQPMKWRDLPIRDKYSYTTAIASFVIGWGLTIMGFCVPPLGEISPSVLSALGIALSFTASVLGIATYFDAQLRNFKREIRKEIKADDEDGTDTEKVDGN